MQKNHTTLLLISMLLSSFYCNSQDYRYTNMLFSEISIDENIVYGVAPAINFPYTDENNTTDSDLIMDIYSPAGDNLTERPAIVFVHSGAFLNGERNHDDMVAFCQYYAERGYVTATIDYRKGFNLLSNVDIHGTRAVYRGIQDGRSAVRFLRANAATYGIDVDNVYMTGSSAGGFTVLHAAYMNDPDEQPVQTEEVSYTSIFFPFFFNGPDLGPVDTGDNLEVSGQPDAIISLWGAIQSTDLITETDTTPIFLAHGTGDSTVPFETDNPFSYPLFPEVDGSNPINNKLEALGFTNKETYFVDGEPHEFYGTDNGNWPDEPNAFWTIILDKTNNFSWLQHKPTVDFEDEHLPNLEVTFTDISIDAVSWLWDFGDGITSTEQSPSHIYDAIGDYDVTLYIENDIRSWDEIQKNVSVEEILGVQDISEIVIVMSPNPATNLVSFTSTDQIDDIKIYNVLGQIVLSTAQTKAVSVSFLNSGIYTVEISSNLKKIYKRLIKN